MGTWRQAHAGTLNFVNTDGGSNSARVESRRNSSPAGAGRAIVSFATMSALPPSPGATLRRVLVASLGLTLAVGVPAVGAASAMSQGQLGLGMMLRAAAMSAVGAAVSTLMVRTLLGQIWVAWVGLLSGVTPSSLVMPRSRQLAHAAAYLVGGAAIAALGYVWIGTGEQASSETWALLGAVTTLAGLGLGLGGAIPHAWWWWRGSGIEQPDETVSRHLGLFVWLGLSALSLAQAMSETLTGHFAGPEGVPLRRAHTERGCVSTNPHMPDICPPERRYTLKTRGDGRLRLSWFFAANCEIRIEDAEQRASYRDGNAFVPLDAAPARTIAVTLSGLDTAGCWYQLRARPVREDAP